MFEKFLITFVMTVGIPLVGALVCLVLLASLISLYAAFCYYLTLRLVAAIRLRIMPHRNVVNPTSTQQSARDFLRNWR